MHKHSSLSQFHITENIEVRKLGWNVSLGTIAGALITIFVPIYLYQLNYPLWQIFGYFCLIGVFAGFQHFVSAYLIRFIGPNRIIALSDLSDIIAYMLLATLTVYGWPIWLIAFFKGSGKGLYWPAFHASFARDRNRKSPGTQIGILSSLLLLAGVIGPAIGGAVADNYGLQYVYLAGGALMLISALPLIFGPNEFAGYRLDYSKLKLKQAIWDYSAGFSYSLMSLTQMLVWPLVTFLFISNYVGVGLLSSVITLASIAVTLYVGKREKKKGELGYIREGSILGAITGSFRLIAETAPAIFSTNLLSGVTYSLIHTPFVTRYYKNSDNEPRVEYVVGMELAHSLAWAFYGGVLALLSLFLPLQTVLFIGLAIAVPASFGVRLIK